MSAEQKLRDLKDLLDVGAITQAEYARKRQHVLSMAKESVDKGKTVTRGSSGGTTEQPKKTVVRRKRVERGKSGESDKKDRWAPILVGLLTVVVVIAGITYLAWDYLPNGQSNPDEHDVYNTVREVEETVDEFVPEEIAVAEESVSESIDFAGRVKSYLLAQNSREVQKVLDYWSDDAVKYYDISFPVKTEIDRLITEAWSNTIVSSNTIMSVSNPNRNTVVATVHFEFQRVGDPDPEYVVSKNKYVFDDDGLLLEESVIENLQRSSDAPATETGNLKTVNADNVNFRRQPNLDDWVKSEESGVMVPNKIRELKKGEKAKVLSGQIADQDSNTYLLKRDEWILDADGNTVKVNSGVAVRLIDVDWKIARCVAIIDGEEAPPFDMDLSDLDPISNYNWKRVRIRGEEGYVLDRFLD